MKKNLFLLLLVGLLCSCASNEDKTKETMQRFLTAVETKDMNTALSLYPQYAELKDNVPYKLSKIEPEITESENGFTFSYTTQSRGTICYEICASFDVNDGIITSSRNYYHPKSEALFSLDFMQGECGNKDRTAVSDVDFKKALQDTNSKYKDVIKGLTAFKTAYMKKTPELLNLCPTMLAMKNNLADVSYEAWAIKKIVHGESSMTGKKEWLVVLQGDVNYTKLSLSLSDDCKTVNTTTGFLVRETAVNDYPGRIDRNIYMYGTDQDVILALIQQGHGR